MNNQQSGLTILDSVSQLAATLIAVAIYSAIISNWFVKKAILRQRPWNVNLRLGVLPRLTTRTFPSLWPNLVGSTAAVSPRIRELVHLVAGTETPLPSQHLPNQRNWLTSARAARMHMQEYNLCLWVLKKPTRRDP